MKNKPVSQEKQVFLLYFPHLFVPLQCILINEDMEDDNVMMATEPMAATLSESVSRSGLLGQVMSLSRHDKEALIAYLKKDVEIDEPFKTDESGRVLLTKERRDVICQAEIDFEEGRCLGEEAFQKRFAKWL